MNFNEAENYLLSLGNEVTAMKLGLENVSKLFAELGDPQKNYLKVQVAGTNGKGSVCAFINSICLRAGIETGMYTSPHLISITERIQINGAAISEYEFARLATRVREASETLVERGDLESAPTFFEQVTAIALLAFADAKVELAILETGLGGRLDATTAARAEIAAITRIDIDHQKYLGDTLKEIAAEKAAIIHPESKVVALRQSRIVEDVIRGRCREVGVEPVWSTDNIRVYQDPAIGASLFGMHYTTENGSHGNAVLWGMHGRHQIENAALAVGIAELLNDTGFKIDSRAIEFGLEDAIHPGRLEWIGRYLLDGAHNAGGAKALADYLNEFVERPVILVFGAMNDKDVNEIAKILFPLAARLILTKPANSRAVSANDLVAAIPAGTDRKNVFKTDNLTAALQKAEEVSDPDDTILVTGSLYLVGEARGILSEVSGKTEN